MKSYKCDFSKKINQILYHLKFIALTNHIKKTLQFRNPKMDKNEKGHQLMSALLYRRWESNPHSLARTGF